MLLSNSYSVLEYAFGCGLGERRAREEEAKQRRAKEGTGRVEAQATSSSLAQVRNEKTH